jgi:amino acid adenylation domain-containing protein
MTSIPRESSSLLDSARVPIPKAVAAQAARNPDAIAALAGSQFLTYGELDSQANRLARELRSRGAGPEAPVGLCLPRSLEYVVAALGILKSGAAYIPLDPAHPAERLSYMLRDAGALLAVTDSETAGRLPDSGCELINITTAHRAGPDHLPRIEILPGDLAYIIYTSGSTGHPKGVEITHGNLANLVAWHREAFRVRPSDRASHLAGLGFDASVWELWPYLVSGASLHLADEITRSSPELLRDWLVSARLTISFVPTPLAERMLTLDWPEETRLRFLLTGGDALHHYPAPKLPFTLINNYGPTECTVVATSGVVAQTGPQSSMPHIGRAIAGAEVFLLDADLKPVPDGSPGEIYIGGAGVARGYRNRPDLTSQRFLANPFGAGRLYKTGDLARRLPSGDFEFAGRADDQIKIRGYRIEPNEVVRALNQHPRIEDSIVVARPHPAGSDEKRLIAYVISRDAGISPAELRQSLRQRLPEYMVPSVFVRVAEFPVSQNGKIHVARLPEPTNENTLADPATESASFIEQRVSAIVKALLATERLDREDNFFLLGGHSLMAAQLMARLRDAFGIEIPLRTLFASPTVSMLADYIETHSAPAAEVPGNAAKQDCAVTNP